MDAGHDDASQMPIYNSVLGQDGDEDEDYCVEDPLWNRDAYPTTYLCSEAERELDMPCCLKRHKGVRGHIPDGDTLAPHVYSYRRWRDFQEAVLKEHTYVHAYVSGNVNATHMFGHNAAEDPLFVLLHNFLMYLRALRTTCFGYDVVINELEHFQPYAYDPYQDNREADMKPFVDVPMDFTTLAEKPWARAYSEDITVRKVFDLREFDISFELGSFWFENAQLEKYCGDNLNETWFYDSSRVSEKRELLVNRASQLQGQVVEERRYSSEGLYAAVFVLCMLVGAIGYGAGRLQRNQKGLLLEEETRCEDDCGINVDEQDGYLIL